LKVLMQYATKLFSKTRTASDTGALFITMHQMLSVHSINCDQVNGARKTWQAWRRGQARLSR